MSARATRVVATAIGVAVVGCMPLHIILTVTNGNPIDVWASQLVAPAFAAMGVLVLFTRPANSVGWIFSAFALLLATGFLADQYGEYAYVTRPGSLPAPVWAVWYAEWFWIPMLALILVLLALVFPTGRLLSSRRRPVL